MKKKTILTSGGMSTIFRLLLATVLLSNLPEVYFRLMNGHVSELMKKVDAQWDGPFVW